MLYTKQKENNFFVKTSKIATLDKVQNFELNRKSQLNNIIKNADGSPDYLAINIYYDTLRSWYTPNKLKTSNSKILEVAKLKTKGIYLSYKELAKAHGCSSETIRRKLVKLEKLGLIQRSYQHKETVTTKSYNQLIIYVWKQTPYFYNKHGIEQSKIPKLKPQTNHEYIAEKYNIDYHSQTEKIKAITKDGGIHKEVDTKKLIEPFNKLKDRSRTNFVKNSFDSFSDEKSSIVEPKNNPIGNSKTKKGEIRTSSTTQKISRHSIYKENKIINNRSNKSNFYKFNSSSNITDQPKNQEATKNTKITKNGFLGSGKHLNEMLEYLTEEICAQVRAECGRHFTDRAINQIAKAVSRSKKGAKAFFYHINGFIT